ncbi:hypothetical protein DIPPA_13881 [Diplonema papillatum]|nr:hypothetical protein DIPPA_13881 [Diplonema papillatum]
MGIRLQKEKDEKKVEVTLAQQQTAEKEAIIEQLHKAQSQAARDHEKLVAELAAAMAGKDSEMQQLRSRVERESGRRLEAKLADAERLHAELQKKYESLAGKLKEAQQAEVRLVEELDLKSSAATELQVQISRDAEELNKLKEECRVHQDSRARDQDVHDAAARQLKAEAAKLEAQVAALQGEAGALKTSVHRQRAGAEESKHELTARIGALAEAVHDGEKQLARQAADAEAKLLILQRTIDDKAAVIAKQDGARQQLENALHKSEQAEKKARSELSESQAELRKCRSTLETTTAALGRAEEQAKAAAAGGHHGKERDSLQAQLDDVKRALADEVKRHADTEAQHAAASKHWKTAADESRKAADARIDSIKRDYQSKLDSLHAKLVDTRHDAASQAQKHSKAKQEIETLRAERRTWEQDVQRKLEQLKNDEISHVEAHLAAHTQGEVSRHVLEHDLLKRDYQEEQQKVAQAKERLRDAEAAHRDDIARLRVEFDDQLRRELEEQAKLRQAIELQLSQQVAKTQAEAERCSVVEGKWRKASEDLKKREDELMRQVAHVTESIEGQVSWTAGQIEAEKAEHAKLEEQLEKAKGDLRTALAKAEARERDRMEEVRAAEAKARGVSSELAASQAACEAVGAQLAEVKGLLETAAQRNASTEDAAARRTEELTRQLHASREREVKLELQTEQLTKQLQDAVLQAERTKGAMAAQADELTEARAEEREATRRVRLAEGNALKAADENRDLRAQLADAGSLLGHAQSELETVHRRYARVADDARKQDEEQDHKARMLEHSVRREGLAGQLSRDDAALAEKRHSDLHKALRAKEKECASLQEELSSARRDADTADQALRHQLRLTHAKLAHQQAAASDLETALASAEASEKALHSDLDSHVQLLEQLRSELEAARDARLKAETRSQAMACKAAELEVKLKTTEQEHVAKLRKMREDSKNELYEHQKRAADASEHAATLQGTLKLTRESLDKTISSQRGDKSRTVEDVELLRRQVFELKSDNEEKEAALEVERTKCQQAEAEKQALRRSAEGLSETVTRLRLDLRSAETHLAAANSQQGQSEADRASKEDNRQKELHEARLRVEAETLRALAAETAVSHSREHADDMKAEIASLKLRLQDHWRCEEVLASARSLADRDRETARSEIESLKARQQAAVRGLEEARHDAAQWQEKASQLSLSEAQLSRSVRAAEERCAKLRKDAIPAAAELERLGLQKLALTDALNAADRREADLRSQLRQAGGHAALDMVPALRAERAERAETQQHALTQASAARDNIGRMRSEVLARETLLHAQRTPMPHR